MFHMFAKGARSLLLWVQQRHGATPRAGCTPVGSVVGRVSVLSRQPKRLVGQVSPEPGARTPVSLSCETGSGARASCSLEGLHRPASRSMSRSDEPGARGRPETIAHQS